MVSIEVLAIGDEVLAGFTLNSNSTFISAELRKCGYPTASHRVVPDASIPLKKALEKALTEHDILICTGGLGPTADDRTRTIISQAFETEMQYSEEVAERLKQRYGDACPSLENQATIPASARPFHNGVGTAPALLLEKNGKLAFFLPGVPVEMRALFTEQVLPYVQERFPVSQIKHRRIISACCVRESDVDEFLRKILSDFPEIEWGIYPSLGTVSVHLLSQNVDSLDLVEEKVIEHLGKKVFKGSQIQEAIHHYFIEHGLTLSLAESCTGGALSASLTQIPCSSQYFQGAAITYSNAMKRGILSVDSTTLESCGAVSAEVAKEMAEGVQKISGSDYAIAVSGVAGPGGGSEAKPVGTVWIAVAKKGEETYAELLSYKGNRTAIIQRAVNYALGILWQSLPTHST